jgi:hypothetical protein
MAAETLSSPEPLPVSSTTSSESNSSYDPEHLYQFYKELKIFSKANSHWFRLSKKFRDAYESLYKDMVIGAIVAFENSRSIPADKKNQIRKDVHNAIGRIRAYEVALVDGSIFFGWGVALSFLSGILFLIFSGVLSQSVEQSLIAWLGFYIVAGLVLLLLLVFSVWLFIMLNKKKTGKVQIFLTYCILLVPSFPFFWSQNHQWTNSSLWLGHALTFGSLSAMIINSGMFAGLLSFFVWRSYYGLQYLKKYPRDEFISKSIDTLIRLGDPDSWRFKGLNLYDRSLIVYYLERMSLSLEYLLTQQINDYDDYTQTWLKQNAIQIADDVRKLKQLILLPIEGSRHQVIQAVAHKLVLVAQENWGELERCELPPRKTRRVKLIAWLRSAFSLAIPVLFILAMQLSPLPINDAVENSITTLAVGWAVVALLNLIDPTALSQINAGAGLTGLLKK